MRKWHILNFQSNPWADMGWFLDVLSEHSGIAMHSVVMPSNLGLQTHDCHLGLSSMRAAEEAAVQ